MYEIVLLLSLEAKCDNKCDPYILQTFEKQNHKKYKQQKKHYDEIENDSFLVYVANIAMQILIFR